MEPFFCKTKLEKRIVRVIVRLRAVNGSGKEHVDIVCSKQQINFTWSSKSGIKEKTGKGKLL